jgi:hypothetical protein
MGWIIQPARAWGAMRAHKAPAQRLATIFPFHEGQMQCAECGGNELSG